jgi:hypothetical protein
MPVASGTFGQTTPLASRERWVDGGTHAAPLRALDDILESALFVMTFGGRATT